MLHIFIHQGNANGELLKFHLTLVRMAIIMKSNDSNVLEDVEKGNLYSLFGRVQTDEVSHQFLKKLKRNCPYDSATLLLGTQLRDSTYPTRRDTSMIIAALFTVAKI